MNVRALALSAFLLSACAPSAPLNEPAATPPAAALASARAIVSALDRTAKDRALDPGRHPAELLAFLDLKPGMKVADLGAGPGYTTELLVHAVGPTGVVYLHNEPSWLPFLQDDLRDRFGHAVMRGRNVAREDHEFENPLPDVKSLDLVVMNLIYHDIVNTPTDRAKMNAHVFEALRPGGRYVVIDSSARPGSGVSATETLHRIDEEVVRAEIPRAGFTLVAEGTFLRNAADPRDWSSAPGAAEKAGKRGTGDRFVLAFERPANAASSR